MEPKMIEMLANFGVPTVLLFCFIAYSAKIYNHLSMAILRQGEECSKAILRQGEENNKAISSVVERFDKTLERHKAVVNHIARSTTRLTEEIARTSAHYPGHRPEPGRNGQIDR